MTNLTVIKPNSEQLPETLDKIEYAITEIRTVDEAKKTCALIDAAFSYAKSYFKGQKDLVTRAKNLKLLAERRLGEILQAMPKATGTAGMGDANVGKSTGGSVLEPPVRTAPTLAEIGIDKKTSMRAQRLAALPDETFNDVLAGELPIAQAIATPKAEKPEPKPKKAKRQFDQRRPSDIPDASLKDDLAEARDAIADLAAENEKLTDRLAVESMEGTQEEKALATQTIAELRERVRVLEAENDALKASRDSYMNENAEMKKQINYWRKAAGKAAA